MIDKFQQQILFDEIDTKNADKQLTLTDEQVVFDNQDWQPEAEQEHEQSEIIEKSKPRWLLRAGFAIFSGIVGYELYQFFALGFQQSPIVAGLYAALFAIITVIFGTTAFRELSALRQLSKQEKIRSQVQDILDDNGKADARKICEKISKQLPCDLTVENEKAWGELVQPEFSDAEVIQLYSKEVLSSVDQKALDEVAKFSTESVVLIAISPVALIDMMLMFWRNIRMINKIAGLYGLKLSYWSRIRLIKQVFINMAYAGASEIITDFGADLLGADILGKLSGRMAQGLGAGMLTARLGIKTIKVCRPIPFHQDSPKLNDVRKKIAHQVKGLLKSS